MWGLSNLTFSGGCVREIRIDRPMMEVTTFGASMQEFMPAGPARMTMTLELTDPAVMQAVLMAVGATREEQAQLVAPLRQGPREVGVR